MAHGLQCIIPVIEGLLPPEDEKEVLNLIFILSTWHAYAKLQLHTDHTLASFNALTKPLGAALRHFAGEFSDQFDTKELPKEADAQKWRDAKGSVGKTKTTKSKWKASLKVRLNLSTYKLHALGDYADTICWRGTTDSYGTQMVRVSSINIPLTDKIHVRESVSTDVLNAFMPTQTINWWLSRSVVKKHASD